MVSGRPFREDRTSQPPQACFFTRAFAPRWTSRVLLSCHVLLRLPAGVRSSVHSRSDVSALPSARCCQASGPVPPSRFLTALTASSARTSRVCCTPLPARGSSRFHRGDREPEGPRWLPSSPRCSFPSKDPPRRQPFRITAVCAFLPFCSLLLSSGSTHSRARMRDPGSVTSSVPPATAKHRFPGSPCGSWADCASANRFPSWE